MRIFIFMTFFWQVQAAGETIARSISGEWSWLVVGLALFIAAGIVIFFLKNVLINTALGLIGWGILTYIFQISIPFWVSLLVTGIFGLAGLGAIVMLAVLGILH